MILDIADPNFDPEVTFKAFKKWDKKRYPTDTREQSDGVYLWKIRGWMLLSRELKLSDSEAASLAEELAPDLLAVWVQAGYLKRLPSEGPGHLPRYGMA